MDSLREIGKFLIVVGVCLAAVGAWLAFGGRVPLRLGRLPGDIAYRGKHGNFYFPIVTCILLSVVLTVVLWVVNLFRR